MIEAKVICDSIGEHSPRLTTFLTRYPKFIHAEHMRHRTGSYCVSSSRAIPVAKNLEEVRSDELRASPVWWGKEQKGMQSGEELDDTQETCPWSSYPDIFKTPYDAAQQIWKKAATDAAIWAENLNKIGAHKSIVNRLLEPFLHVNCLMTICEPGLMNFFGLRLDKAAQPEMRVLAEQMWKAWNESTPRKLEPEQWHLPFIDDDDQGLIYERNRFVDYGNSEGLDDKGILEDYIHVSVARCARLSYLSFETGKRSTIKEDLALYQRLVGAHPIHASPAEHQATPDTKIVWYINEESNLKKKPDLKRWNKPHLHGNFLGWVQYRKMLPGEAVAPLPNEYK